MQDGEGWGGVTGSQYFAGRQVIAQTAFLGGAGILGRVIALGTDTSWNMAKMSPAAWR